MLMRQIEIASYPFLKIWAHYRGYSPLAQSVEQVTVNHWVAGSSPAGGANSFTFLI